MCRAFFCILSYVNLATFELYVNYILKLQEIGFHTNMPTPLALAPMSPPPEPPIYVVNLPTPNPSHDNDNVSLTLDSAFFPDFPVW